MKRDRSSLSAERTATETDARLRRAAKVLTAAEARAERRAAANRAAEEKLRSNLNYWNSDDIRIATEWTVSEPEANPIGVQLRPHHVPRRPVHLPDLAVLL